MLFSFFDGKSVSETILKRKVSALNEYKDKIYKITSSLDSTQPEYALAHSSSPEIHNTVIDIQFKFKKIKHLVLIGIGGSSLGTEAVHAVLNKNNVCLHVLDCLSASKIEAVVSQLKKVKKIEKIGVCIVSKSGNTIETLTNANAALSELEKLFGKKIYKQTVCVGEKNNPLLNQGKSLGCQVIHMPASVSGRFSVGTEASLVPLAMLGYDMDAFMAGINDSNEEEAVKLTAENAARISIYLNNKFSHYNFFAFDPKLEKLGQWYRQLFAESLGKATDISKKSVKEFMVPTISTPRELHSIGQLYLSGLKGMYTDFVVFDDPHDIETVQKGFGKDLKGLTLQEIATAIYGGVINAYRQTDLPYRSTIFNEELTYSLGFFMGMRMREIMYVAKLQKLNAFDQPNVEAYKTNTKTILGL